MCKIYLGPNIFKLHPHIDGILRERHKHACGRNLKDCGRICGIPHKSEGTIEEMFQMINNVDGLS